VPKIKITLRKSGIGHEETQKATIKALGFHRLNQSIVKEDSSSLRGMIQKIKHLVTIEEAN
jgi:large subunit ribosomal protein L30